MQGSKTFIKNIYNTKEEIIKKERITFATKELKFRYLVLNYNPNRHEQQQINAHRDGVYVLDGKTKSVSAGLEKSDISSDNQFQPRLSASWASYKEKLRTLSSSSLFSTSSASKSLTIQPQEKIKAKKYALKSSW